ncbi:MAG: hypothetical protein DRO01_01705 [Thermoproteota archaeon]|nr:MAG: hypothetical protein DRO01_01705 [Candidatus Korarchaeota archaeon]
MRVEEAVGLLIVGLVIFSIGASLAAPALAPRPTQREVEGLEGLLGQIMEGVLGPVTACGGPSSTGGQWTIELDPQEARAMIIRVGFGSVELYTSGSTGEAVVVEMEGVREWTSSEDVISLCFGEVRVYLPPGFAFDNLTIEVGTGEVRGTLPISPSGSAEVDLGTGDVQLDLAPQSLNGVATLSVGMGSAEAHGFDSTSESPGELRATLGSGGGFTLEVDLGMGDAEVRVSGP